jgi:membrane protease YdiL (CAAX protease family)
MPKTFCGILKTTIMTKDLNKKVLLYSVIAYGVTWTIAFGIYLLYKKGNLSNYQLNLYHSFAAIGPTIAALITTYSFYGKPGVKKLVGKIGLQVLDKKTVLFIVSPLAFFGLGLIIYPFIKSEGYSFGNFANLHWTSFNSTVVWFLPLLTYSVFEEIGWRGFLLPHLQEYYTAWKATIFLTIIWALWHIPFFFYRFDFSLGISIGFFFGIFVGAIILTSIYNSGKGILIPVMVFHFLNNLCSEFDKKVIAAVLSTGFVFLAIFIYKKFGRENLSETNRTMNYMLD